QRVIAGECVLGADLAVGHGGHQVGQPVFQVVLHRAPPSASWRSRTLRGRMSVQISSMWSRHSCRSPVKPVARQPSGGRWPMGSSEYCSSSLTTTWCRPVMSFLLGSQSLYADQVVGDGVGDLAVEAGQCGDTHGDQRD